MFQRYPSYPSQLRHTPPNYFTKDEGQSKMLYPQYHDFSVIEMNKNHLAPKNHTQSMTFEHFESGHGRRGNEQYLEKTLYNETCANIKSIINSNTIAIKRLQNHNEFLLEHLENLKEMFFSSPSNQRQRYHNFSEQKQENTQKYMAKSQQKLTQKSYYQHFSERESPRQSPANEYEQSWGKKQTGQYIQDGEDSVEIVQKGAKKIYYPSKGPVRYTKQSWIKEQYSAQEFLHGFMRYHIEETPSQPQNIVKKRKILKLYLRWRKVKKLGESELNESKIQQVLTNEIKVVFGCTCTTNDFLGLKFKHPSEWAEKEGRNQYENFQGRKMTNGFGEKKERRSVNAKTVKEEMVEEEFSLEQLEGDC